MPLSTNLVDNIIYAFKLVLLYLDSMGMWEWHDRFQFSTNENGKSNANDQ